MFGTITYALFSVDSFYDLFMAGVQLLFIELKRRLTLNVGKMLNFNGLALQMLKERIMLVSNKLRYQISGSLLEIGLLILG